VSTRLTVPILTFWLAACNVAPAQGLSSRDVYQRTLRGTVLIGVRKAGKVVPAGTGFVVDASRGFVVTNYHVTPDSDCFISFPMFKDGRVVSDPAVYRLDRALPGKVVDSDPQNDLAVIRLTNLAEELPELKLAAMNPQPGDRLHLVGNPGVSSGRWVYTSGTVRQLVRRAITYSNGQAFDTTVIESQMAVNFGDSGSAVVDDRGEVVGVTSGAAFSEKVHNLAWHVDLDELKRFLADVRTLEGGKAAPAAVYERRAMRRWRKGQLDLALADLDRAIAQDGQRGSAYRQRCRLHFHRKQYDAALADANRALDIDPEDGLAANIRGNVFAVRGDHARAIENYTLAIGRLPADATIRVNRGIVLASSKQLELALADFNEAIRLDPGSVDAYAERGSVHRARKDYPRAAQDFEAALKLAPSNNLLLAYLGVVYLEGGQPSLAADTLQKAVQGSGANQAVVWRFLGKARFALKQYDLAVHAYSEAIKGNPKDADAWFGRGLCREEQGELDLAQPDYTRGVELAGAYARHLTTYAVRQVRVANGTDEPLKVHGEVQVKVGDSWVVRQWVWNIAPGATVLLNDDRGTVVQARQCRLWAVGTRTGKRWENLKKRPLLLVETPYRARKVDTHEHRFGG
jgi:tetratricopeptide (TPR) repeat protein